MVCVILHKLFVVDAAWAEMAGVGTASGKAKRRLGLWGSWSVKRETRV